MHIVDAQIHLWASGLPSNLAHRQVTQFSAAEAIGLMDEGGIDAAVIHPPPWDPGAHKWRWMRCCAIPAALRSWARWRSMRRGSRDLIAEWRQRPGMLGLRYMFLNEPARRWLHEGALDWLWPAAESVGVPIAVMATDSLALFGQIAERHPGLRLTIDHLGGRGGNTTLKDDAAMTHMPELLALAKFPNVAVKATGVPGYSSEAYPFPALHIYLRQVYDAFGPERMFWGTASPKCRARGATA